MLKKLATIALLLPLLASCQDANAPSGTSKVTLMLTDDPGFASAMVTIDGIYLQGGNDGGDAGRVWLSQTPVTTDLLTLKNDVLGLVDNVEVPSGHYADLRFVISGGYVEVENADGTTSLYATPDYGHLPDGVTPDGSLQMPSYVASGLKVKFDGGTVDITGTQEVLLVDFDVSQSFGHDAGGAGGWVMTPVIRGAHMDLTSSATVTLALADTVTLPSIGGTQVQLGDFTAVLDDGLGNTKDAAFASVNGVYTASFPYLMPETTWALQISGPAGLTFTTDPVLPGDVTTSSGQDAHFEVVITSAAPSAP
ncbi:MAG: DUF4382 domain-containing protein [Gemmatimonadetes bacterium]|nr:DUF4382 domain-containing protein [Gemmatimonadota bacterium]